MSKEMIEKIFGEGIPFYFIYRFVSSAKCRKSIRLSAMKQTARPPLHTVRKQSYAAVNSCLLALTKLQCTSGVNVASVFIFKDSFNVGEERV